MQKPSIYGCQQNLFEVEAIKEKPKQKKQSEGSYVFDILDALNAPVLTFGRLWADIIPKRILKIVPLARMMALMKREQLATYAECVIYLYTRTLEAPMDYEWTDIYIHISCKTLEEWFNENHWKDTGAPKELSEWLLSKLNGLRYHIYEKRRDILKGQLRNEERKEKEVSGEEKKETVTKQQVLKLGL